MLSLLKEIDLQDIILASASPRRYELLKLIDLEFRVIPSHVEEIYSDHLTPIEYVQENARNKGRAVAGKYPSSLMISADTIVVLNDHILEKPRDERHAREILTRLSGHTHTVLTSFGLFHQQKGREVMEYESTRVTFRNLTQDEIFAYLETGEPFDKAGAYGAQKYGALLIEKVDGCFFNVIGLPLSKFFTTLSKFLISI